MLSLSRENDLPFTCKGNLSSYERLCNTGIALIERLEAIRKWPTVLPRLLIFEMLNKNY